MREIKRMKVVRVNKYEFELEDGQVFEHIEPLEEVPTLEEFQRVYDSCHKEISDKLKETDDDGR